jgi:hypothetical protein
MALNSYLFSLFSSHGFWLLLLDRIKIRAFESQCYWNKYKISTVWVEVASIPTVILPTQNKYKHKENWIPIPDNNL